jgi:hypothetical protein
LPLLLLLPLPLLMLCRVRAIEGESRRKPSS